MSRQHGTRTELVRLGFSDPARASAALTQMPVDVAAELTASFASAADPDQALRLLLRLRERAGDRVDQLLRDPDAAASLVRVLGASSALGDFLERHPDALAQLTAPPARLPTAGELGERLGASDSVDDLRVRYRLELLRIAAWDLASESPIDIIDQVAAALADLAGATLDAALGLTRAATRFGADEVAATRLAIIGMGKAGARELNYVSDVDVMFVAAGGDGVDTDRAVMIATELAKGVTAVVSGLATEPPLWPVDANLRPEGAAGALVRSLESHVAYYERWAQSWEFQALLKARPLAGDRALGDDYLAAIGPLVWASSSRESFVDSVQGMRQRVTDNVPADERDVQLKLGPGGLRDVEFTIQLLQLVHGATDDTVRGRDTLGALDSLAAGGYIGRTDAQTFARDYRFLRLLEHRLQLEGLTRTHLMPREPEAVRVLARATRLATNAAELTEQWQATRTRVRTLHERLFYRPLLSAVAALPGEGFALTSDRASARLAAIGFVDPDGALRHIEALTGGISRRATIHRNLLPVLLQWFAEGADPDLGLLTYRRLSETLGESPWYLRMLRDSSVAARRLTSLLSGSRYVSELFLAIPESAKWLENSDELAPRSLEALLDEGSAIVRRHRGNPDAAASPLRTMRRRELLRTAIASMVGRLDTIEAGVALTNVTTATIQNALGVLREDADFEFGVVAMGRYGGRELGFGSDADVMYVFRAGEDVPDAQQRAVALVRRLVDFTSDSMIPFDLDADLRPEGKNGPLVRSLDAYRAYYERWSLTWESQALLRARAVAGDESLLADFTGLADTVRYPEAISKNDLREVKRIKARVESERLPQGADPARHLKLGRGSLSDVEWLVQVLQLEHGARFAELRTTSTLGALEAATEVGLVPRLDAAVLRDAWLLASRVRSALTLWTAKTTDVLPRVTEQLDGVARLVGYPPRSAGALENDYLRVTRRARSVFERLFFD